MKNKLIALLVAVLGIITGTQLATLGAAPGGASATVATSSLVNVGAVAKVIFATSTNCTSRMITNIGDTDIWFDVADRVPIAEQANVLASTTNDSVEYDGGIWGCTAIRAISGADTVIKVTEFRSFQ